MKQIRYAAESKLSSLLDRASRDRAVGMHGAITRFQYGTALSNTNSSVNQVIRVLRELILMETGNKELRRCVNNI